MQRLILEKSLNALLEIGNIDITPLTEKTIHFHLKHTPLDLFFVCNNNRIFVLNEGNTPDVDMTLEPAVFLALFKGEALKDLLKKDKIIMSGDMKTAQLLVDLFEQVEIDPEEWLSYYTGDIIAHEIGNIARKIRQTDDPIAKAKDKISRFLIQPNVVS
jgi:ubiquinone biosynthesis protein UbiJ